MSIPYVIAEMRDEPKSCCSLFLGFDSKARAIEVITDTGTSGQMFIIHADLITRKYEKLLEEVIKLVMIQMLFGARVMVKYLNAQRT